MRSILCGATVAAISWSGCHASVVSATGMAFVPAPTGILDGSSNFIPMQIWDELQGVTASNVAAAGVGSNWDLLAGPFPTPGSVSGTFDSHRIYSSDPHFYNATIRFSGAILAVMINENMLAPTDSTFAPPGLFVAPRGQAGFGDLAINIIVNNDTLTLVDANGHPLGFGDVFEMRVLTAVPAPGAAFGLVLALGLARSHRRRVR